MGTVDLGDLARRLADRKQGRTEANVQSDLHMLLTAAPLQLEDGDLQEITLESPAGQRRRIDVEAGFCVFEVKRDLRVGNVRADAVIQLGGYVASRTQDTGQRYVGVLTDGAEWHLHHLRDGELVAVSTFNLDPRTPDVDGLCVWLEGVLATAEHIAPTPTEIEQRLGAASPAHALDIAELTELYRAHGEDPGIVLKRELWTKLLTTAFGTNFTDDDALFVEHTLLVVTAEIIGHAVVGFDPTDASIPAATLLSGRLFSVDAQIGGVIDADFFDWPAETPGGETFVRALARRLARFAWTDVEHDVMKVLYESVIDTDQRHRLGEYYTPDWLAEAVVEETVPDPLSTTVLDPACGSGTFLFHAVRRYLAAADAAGTPAPAALEGATRAVTGLDVHPVAVTLARITYLLAIGVERLRADDRPEFFVPVYLGDAMQWGQQRTLINTDALTVPTEDGGTLFAEQLQFPEHLLGDAGRFDRLVADLATMASTRAAGSKVPSLASTFRLYAIDPADQPMITETFRIMCGLHDRGRNHIWGYYLRNLARPMSLARPDNRVDALVGNPPWLAYRFMTPGMKVNFRDLSEASNFWAGAAVATNQDLSALFVARALDLYLRPGGRFGMVMPLAVLSRRQYAGFRTGRWSAQDTNINAELGRPWDLHAVKPSFFPVPACVVFGTRTESAGEAIKGTRTAWAGRLSRANVSLAAADPRLVRTIVDPNATGSTSSSPYAERFTQGATLVPRLLLSVSEDGSTAKSPLGSGSGRRAVRSRRSANEKRPWKELPDHTGTVERQFIHPMHLGDTVLPFRLRESFTTVVPWDGTELLDGSSAKIDYFKGLADWWRRAEQVWEQHRTSSMSLVERIDYQRTLRGQFPAAKHRVVYTKAGMYLAAAVVSDDAAVIDHGLYWASARSLTEARYLTAVFNSEALLELVRPLQARGEHNPRHFDKYVFQLPIPLHDPDVELHGELAGLAERAEQAAAAVELPEGKSFQTLRRSIRTALVDDGVSTQLDEAVRELLAPP